MPTTLKQPANYAATAHTLGRCPVTADLGREFSTSPTALGRYPSVINHPLAGYQTLTQRLGRKSPGHQPLPLAGCLPRTSL